MLSVVFAQLAAPTAMLLLSAGATPPASSAERSATVVFAGDVVPHGDLLSSFEAHGPASLCAPVAPVIRAADLALLNFETPASTSHPINRSGLRFNVHDDFVHALVDAGFDAASVANNHAYDLGIPPVADTVSALRDAGLRPIGGAQAHEDPYTPQRFPLAGSTLCVFAAARILNYWINTPTPQEPRIALARPEVAAEQQALLDAIRRHRASCGAVIVSLHTGVEYQDRPEPIDRVFFRRVADAGADVVIGHHSHTPQPVELYRTGEREVPLFFSLGNLVSNQGNSADANVDPSPGGRWVLGLDPRVREGLLAVLRFERGNSGALRLAEFGYVPLWTVNTHLQVTAGDAPTISAALMPREGGSDRMLQDRWQRLVHRVGAQFLLPAASLPGGAEGYAASERAVLENRRGASATSDRAVARGGSPVRSQP